MVRNDGTVRHETKLYQILNAARSLKEVVVQERMDGKIYLVQDGKELAYRELKEPPKQKEPQPKAAAKQKPNIPVMSHPWKGPSYQQAQTRKALAAVA